VRAQKRSYRGGADDFYFYRLSIAMYLTFLFGAGTKIETEK